MKRLRITQYNGGYAVWWQYDGFKEWDSFHATKDDAEAHVAALCEEYGYERVE